MSDEAVKAVEAAAQAAAAAAEANKGGDGRTGGEGVAGAGENKPKTAEELQAYVTKLEADKENLNKALHNERKNKGAKAPADPEALANDLASVKTEIEQERKRSKAMRYVSDESEADIALVYYDKLSQGVTDPKEQEKLMQRAAFLAKADKAGENDPINRVTAAMHGGSRGGVNDGAVSPGAAEMGRNFGIGAERLKEANRPIKGLYNS